MRADVVTFLSDLALQGRPVQYDDVFQPAYIAGHLTQSGYSTSSIREGLRLGYARIIGPVRIELTDRGRELASSGLPTPAPLGPETGR